MRKNIGALYEHGGSPIGNSRIKLTNVKDCVKRGLVKEGEDPLEVAAKQLVKDDVHVLHTIGGVVGHDEEQGDELRAIEFPRIKGGKAFDIDVPWFGEVLAAIGQPKGAKVEVAH